MAFGSYKGRVSEKPVNRPDAATSYCAVLGQPIKHSASPAMHNAAFAELGMNCLYLAFEVNPDDLGPVIQGAQSMGYWGLNLTVPHKILALDLVDVLDKSASDWGAVNTIVFEGEDSGARWKPLREFTQSRPLKLRSVGYNTDVGAIVRSLNEDIGLALKGSRVLLLGAGGAGRSAALKLASEGVGEMFLVNRTLEKADAIATEIRKRFPQVNVIAGYPETAVEEIDLVLNATSLGLKPGDAIPLDSSKVDLKKVKNVYDMIYRPSETPLLGAAKNAGCRTANGLGMLLYQGATAFELWTGRTAPVKVMRQALVKNIYGN